MSNTDDTRNADQDELERLAKGETELRTPRNAEEPEVEAHLKLRANPADTVDIRAQ